MRVSSNKDDPGFDAFVAARDNGQTIHAYLDGVEVKECTMADEELGQVTRFVLDADGRVQVDPENQEEAWIETVAGKVDIRLEGGH